MLNITVDKQRLYLFVFHRQRNWKKGKKKSLKCLHPRFLKLGFFWLLLCFQNKIVLFKDVFNLHRDSMDFMLLSCMT